MSKIWVRGKLLRVQGEKQIHVIRFEGKDLPSYVRPDLLYDMDQEDGKDGYRLFQVPDWLAAKEELTGADVKDYED